MSDHFQLQSDVELAYLAGGPRRALYAALAELRAAGAMDATKGRLHRTGTPATGHGAVTRAVYERLAIPVSGPMLALDPTVTSALGDLHERLVSGRLIATREQVIRWRLVRLAALAAIAGVVIWWINRTAEPAALVAAIPLAGLALLILAVIFEPGPSRRTRDANDLLRELRGRHRSLRPGRAPFRRYRPPQLARAVALYGVRALIAADVGFATRAGVPGTRGSRSGRRGSASDGSGGAGWGLGWSDGGGSGGDGGDGGSGGDGGGGGGDGGGGGNGGGG